MNMTRKVIQLAGKTLLVSLPSKWAKNHNIRKGDDIEVEEKSNMLLVKSLSEVSLDKITVNMVGQSRTTIGWALSALYKSGYDEIELMMDFDKMKIVHELVRDLFVGFAVTEQSRNRCLIRSIAKDSSAEFDQVLRRAFLVTISLAESLAEHLTSNKISGDLLELEKTNNQLTNFCERVLIKSGFSQYRKTCFSYVIIWNLEKICDDYKYLIEVLLSQKQPPKNLVAAVEKSSEILRAYYNLYYKFNLSTLNSLVETLQAVKDDIEDQITKSPPQSRLAFSILHSQIIKMSDLSASFVAINL